MAMGSSSGNDLPLAEINVTPLVDVMLVLLIIFMVTVPMMDQGLTLELPETKGEALEASAESQLVLKISQDKRLELNGTSVTLSHLKAKLPGILSHRKEKTLFVRADKDISYGYVAYIIGEVKNVGATKLGLVTLPFEEKP